MSSLSVFDFESMAVRFIGTAEKPEWIAQDVCGVLGIRNYRDALAEFAEDEKGVVTIDTPGGSQQMLTVTEPGLYRLIFKSRKEIAKRFQRWVFHEVLPSIRKTGGYALPEIEKLKLELALTQSRERLLAATHCLAAINPALPALAFGSPDAVVVREVPTTVMVDHSGRPVSKFDGVSITFIAKQYGFGSGKKALDACRAWLRSIGITEDQWIEEPTAHTVRKLPKEILKFLDREFGQRRGDRQRFLGEV